MQIKISNIKFHALESNNNVIKVPNDLNEVKEWMQDGCSDEFKLQNPITDLAAAALYIRTELFQFDVDCTVKEQQLISRDHTFADQPYDVNVTDDQTYNGYDSYKVAIDYPTEFEYLVLADDIWFHWDMFNDKQKLLEQVAYEALLKYLPITISMIKL